MQAVLLQRSNPLSRAGLRARYGMPADNNFHTDSRRRQQEMGHLGGRATLASAGRSKSRRLASARAAAGPRAATAAMNSSAALACSVAHNAALVLGHSTSTILMPLWP